MYLFIHMSKIHKKPGSCPREELTCEKFSTFSLCFAAGGAVMGPPAAGQPPSGFYSDTCVFRQLLAFSQLLEKMAEMEEHVLVQVGSAKNNFKGS